MPRPTIRPDEDASPEPSVPLPVWRTKAKRASQQALDLMQQAKENPSLWQDPDWRQNMRAVTRQMVTLGHQAYEEWKRDPAQRAAGREYKRALNRWKHVQAQALKAWQALEQAAKAVGIDPARGQRE